MPLTILTRRGQRRRAGRAGSRCRPRRRSCSGRRRRASRRRSRAAPRRTSRTARCVAKIVALAEPVLAELPGGLAEGDDDGVGRRVVRLLDAVMGPGDHRLVDDGDRRDRALARGRCVARLRQGLAHEQLVVHASDYTGRLPSASPSPSRNRPRSATRIRMPDRWQARRRIGILTGGGDVPGLNSVIKSVVYRSTEMGDEVLGIRRGWEGLTHLRPGSELDSDYVRPLDRANTRTIDRTGGTWLHTSRTNPRTMRGSKRARLDRSRPASPGWRPATDVYDLTPIVLENIERLGHRHPRHDRRRRHAELLAVLVDAGVPLVAIPKTMDNDVPGTEYCIGFSTAITRARRSDQPAADDARQSTSGSASSGSSAATPASPRCTPPTSRRRGA